MPKRIAKLIHNKILEKDQFLLVCHQNPDGDAIGSVSAVYQMLKKMDKECSIFCYTPVSAEFDFIYHANKISDKHNMWDKKYDAIIFCDSGDLNYAGVDKLINRQNNPYIINIDHHKSNNKFGHQNLVIEKASSTTEVLYNYFVYNDVDIDRHMATAMLVGLITDTGNFSNAGTSRYALTIASKLIAKGAKLNQIRKNIIINRPINTFKLWARVLSRLEFHKKTEIIYTYITQKDLAECESSEDEMSGIANLLNNLQDGKISMLLREKKDGSIKASLRTTGDNVDVSKLAQIFEGGGHKKAAGFSLAGPSDKALKNIWFTLENFAKAGYNVSKD